jgi:sulfhydrogenase subunit beta (sulfur reductase)
MNVSGFLDAGRVADAVAELKLFASVWAPVERDGRFLFREIRDPASVRLDAPRTVHSAKSVLFPSDETVIRFDLKEEEWLETPDAPDDRPRILLGAHPCDTWGLAAFDRWMRDGTPDSRYVRRHEQLTVASNTCVERCTDDAFCDSMGAHRPVGHDLEFFPLPGGWAIGARTSKGEQVTRAWRDLLRPLSNREAIRLAGLPNAIEATFSRRLVDTSGLPAALTAARRSGIWQELAERCLDCGQCVAVCPTCTCFGMVDRTGVDLASCDRCRVWDGCMFVPFAEVAGGHNFRRERFARIRHRMNRKGNWLSERLGIPFCTGCNRCGENCPVGISPLSVFRKVQGHDVAI